MPSFLFNVSVTAVLAFGTNHLISPHLRQSPSFLRGSSRSDAVYLAEHAPPSASLSPMHGNILTCVPVEFGQFYWMPAISPPSPIATGKLAAL
jgi:hypothetical protein